MAYSKNIRAEARRLYCEEHWALREISQQLKIALPTLCAWGKKENWAQKREDLSALDDQIGRASNVMLHELIAGGADSQKILAVATFLKSAPQKRPRPADGPAGQMTAISEDIFNTLIGEIKTIDKRSAKLLAQHADKIISALRAKACEVDYAAVIAAQAKRAIEGDTAAAKFLYDLRREREAEEQGGVELSWREQNL